jgi:hypothetical protein
MKPDKLLFVDEVGSNTSQAKDGNFGGETFFMSEWGEITMVSKHNRFPLH